jgi:Asp-tRNA(Asn)/Glu-tRNA(Gln) amidotransferase A subunit family amidase
MDTHTLLTVGFVVLVAAVAFVTARVGAVAIGVLPAAPGVDEAGTETHTVDDAASVAETVNGDAGDDETGDCGGADRWDGSRITTDDLDRIRRHLAKDRFHRRPDDLRPSDDERS